MKLAYFINNSLIIQITTPEFFRRKYLVTTVTNLHLGAFWSTRKQLWWGITTVYDAMEKWELIKCRIYITHLHLLHIKPRHTQKIMTDANWEHSNSVSVNGEWAWSQRPIFSATMFWGRVRKEPSCSAGSIRLCINLTREVASTFPSGLHPDSLQSSIRRGGIEAEAKSMEQAELCCSQRTWGSSACSFALGQQPGTPAGAQVLWYKCTKGSPSLEEFDVDRQLRHRS